ncbi:unnamed protein product [Acanthoscelides obtectus]|uniref:Rad21/Rec8-like protein N-terminal domain-containing protein n=1 Tax=Acanthoscelides obtectus TaxID=200917 RepID=A0A9P0LVT7_ACAOB|nr:unnamed protein product [Acanthoscelides obtectus]CAK1672290.1 hypothetical protein AOBTE_LOCUS28760 [Acanthoscelides obtectus]
MFFDIILLNYQHNGNLGKAWIAATRGIGYISNQDIVILNTRRLCDDLYKFIVSSSGDPKKRFSLRMSAILLHGAIRILNRQIVIIQVDAAKVLQRSIIPAGSDLSSLHEEDEQSEEEHLPHVSSTPKRLRRKRKATPQLTPIEEAPGMQHFDEAPPLFPKTDDVFRHPGHPEAITMREQEITLRTMLPEEGFGADISVEDVIRILESVGSPGKPRPPSENSAKKTSSESSAVEQPIKIAVQAQVYADRGSYLDENGYQVRADRTGKDLAAPLPVHQPSITPMQIEHAIMELPESEELRPTHMEVVETAPTVAVVPPTAETIPSASAEVHAAVVETAEQEMEATRMIVEAKQRKGAVPKKPKIFDEDRKMLDKLMVKTKPVNAVITWCLRQSNRFTGPEVRYRFVPDAELNMTRLYQKLWDDATDGAVERIRAATRGSGVGDIRVSEQVPEVQSGRSTLDKGSSAENLATPRETSSEERRLSRRLTPIRLPSTRAEEPLPTEQFTRRTTEVEHHVPFEQVPGLEAVEEMQVEERFEQVLPERSQPEPVVPMEQEQIQEQQVQIEEAEPVVQATAVQAEHTPELIGTEYLQVVCEKEKTRLELSPRAERNVQKRQQDIVDIALRWDFSRNRLTIEDVCPKPFNKLNMARTFSDLLRSHYIATCIRVTSLGC